MAPLISVVTVIYNAKDSLEGTISSVIEQTYPRVEYIIIDGGSHDGTVELLREYANRVDYWVSEPDRGIYDAMNKGIAAANGEWILFINAGDEFYSPHTLELLSRDLSESADVVYGDVEIRYEDTRVVKRSGRITNLWRGMQFCHQSSAVRRELLVATPFNIDNPIAADLEWFIRAYDSGRPYRYHTGIMSTVSAGGVSDANQLRSVVSIEKAVRCVRNNWWVRLYFFAIKFYVCLAGALKAVLPNSVLRRIRMMRS